MLGLGIGIAAPPTSGIRSLFSAGETGGDFQAIDPALNVGSDTSMWQDTAGATPLTAAEQTVGLWLDAKSRQPLAVSINGTFDDSTGWTLGAGAVVSGGTLNMTAMSVNTVSTTAAVVGDTYLVTYSVTAYTSGTLTPTFGGTTMTSRTAIGTYSQVVNATATNTFRFLTTGTPTASVDNLTITKLARGAKSASQSTAGSRPTSRAEAGHYLVDFDGTDDFMTVAAGGGSTTGILLCAAIRVDGGADAARTLWSDTGTNTGYRLRINASNVLELAAGDGASYTTAVSIATLAVGTSYIVTAWHDGTTLRVQINQGAVAEQAFGVVSAGSAGYTVGRDNGASSNYFHGGVYRLIYRVGTPPDASRIHRLQNLLAAGAGITL